MRKVFILTWCKHIDQIYGATLVFDTIRIGFPTAEIIVFDNNSIPEAFIEIEKATTKVGAKLIKLESEVSHHDYIRLLLDSNNTETPIYIIDPDIIFWKNVETFNTGKLLAGRWLPDFLDNYSNTLTKARVHTSFIYIPSIRLLKEKIDVIERTYWDTDLIKPIAVRIDNNWVRWDTFAQVFECLYEDIEIFSDEMNNCFDHIFCGSHLNILGTLFSNPRLHEIHRLAIHNPTSLKGLWREQHNFLLTSLNISWN